MKKSIIISTLFTFFCLCYLAVRNGLNLPIGIALITSCISNVLNIAAAVKGDEESAKR